MFWGAKKVLKTFYKYCSVRTKKLHYMKLEQHIFFLLDLIIQFKLELSPQNIHNEPLPCILFDFYVDYLTCCFFTHRSIYVWVHFCNS